MVCVFISIKFLIEFFILEQVHQYFFAMATVHDDYSASFIYLFNDDYLAILQVL